MTDRNYTSEYANYQGTPAQRQRNDARKAARRKMAAIGEVKRNDGKDVDHKNGNPKDNSTKNLRVTTKKLNRSFPRTSSSKRK